MKTCSDVLTYLIHKDKFLNDNEIEKDGKCQKVIHKRNANVQNCELTGIKM